MRSSNAIRSYSKLETQSRVEQQQPEQLIALLYDKACTLVRQASNALDNENTQLFHDSTTHATQIVLALRGILDIEKGGETALQLSETYGVIAGALFKTKRTKSKTELGKLYEALSELRSAWDTVARGEQEGANLVSEQTL
jgi:flagellar protein FliS